MIKTYKILNKMFLAIDKKCYNPALQYILVEDSRKFTATNGIILLHWEEKEEDITFKFPEPRAYVKMTHKLDDDREIIYETNIDYVYPDYKRILDNTLGKNVYNIDKIKKLHRLGYLPIEIVALPEGTLVPIHIPMFGISKNQNK